jgi:uncharacterized membrane protein
MEQQPNQFETLFFKASEYANNKLELTKLKAVQKASIVFSSAASSFVLFCILALFAFVLNLGLGLFLGELLGKVYFGFFVLAGFYALLAIIYYSFRGKWIKTPVSNAIIKNLSK